jgi:integrase
MPSSHDLPDDPKKAEEWFKEGVQLLELERGGEVVPAGHYTVAGAWVDYIAGVPLVFVAKQLGHADTRMCERHYGHIARKDLAAPIERLSPKLGLFEPAAGHDGPPR